MQLPSHPWAEAPEALARALKADVVGGLTSVQVAERATQYGENIIDTDSGPSAMRILMRQFANPLIIVLLIAVACTLALSEWMDALIIGFAVMVNAVLGFVQEYKAERAIADIRSYIVERTRVIRDGEEREVDSRDIVPGDLIHLTTGARVTADARLIHTTSLSTDESILTGESLPVSKHTSDLPVQTPLADRENMVFAGTVVVGGTGIALVTHTGAQTEIGALATLVHDTKSEQTPLQIAIGKIAWVIIVAVTIIVALIFVVGIMQGRPLYDMVLISIAIIVGAVPEALPIGLTAVLAIGVERIARKKGIMRSLTAAETLGSTTLILTDKTGTLTEARMQLVHIAPVATLTADIRADEVHTRYEQDQQALLHLALTTADVVVEDDSLLPKDWVLTGSALETNLVRSAAQHDIRISPHEREAIVVRVPFSSVHKFSVAAVPHEMLPEAYAQVAHPHIVVGAPDILLARSQMDIALRDGVRAATEALSEEGRRVLAVALYSAPSADGALDVASIMNCQFLGTISFVDPIRAEVPEALRRIEAHHVRVVMITGDLPGTARAVGKSLGWTLGEDSVLTGEQLSALSDAELLPLLAQVRIFARVTPADKVRIVRLHQHRGEIVAMTGDGVNDGPALKSANIGVAVGSGSDVAKSIADLVLLDNNFGTIVATIEEGKQMLMNIKKVFVYLMSNALDEVILIGGSILLGIAMPLTAMQIIWVNLFTGSIPAIAYAFDKPQVQKRGKAHRSFFDPTVKFLSIGVGIFSSVLLFIMYISLLALSVPVGVAQSVIFVCFSAYILIIAFSFKNLSAPIHTYSLTDNRVLLWGTGLGAVLIGCTIYLPFFQTLFGVAPFPLVWYALIAVWLAVNVLAVESAKWFARTHLA